jgi:hypothetical protein
MKSIINEAQILKKMIKNAFNALSMSVKDQPFTSNHVIFRINALRCLLIMVQNDVDAMIKKLESQESQTPEVESGSYGLSVLGME